MTPTARRVMEKIRQMQPGTYEQWVQMHVDLALEEAADVAEYSYKRQYREELTLTQEIAAAIRALKSPEQEPAQ